MTPLSKNARVTGLLYILSSLFGLVRLVYIPSTLLASGSAAVMINSQDVNNGPECNRQLILGTRHRTSAKLLFIGRKLFAGLVQ